MGKPKKAEEVDSGYRNTIEFSDSKGRTVHREMDYGSGRDHSTFHEGIKGIVNDEDKGKDKK
jgi:hypothetical protein